MPTHYCECCERPLEPGEHVVQDTRIKDFKAYICPACVFNATTKGLIEMFGGKFIQIEEDA